MPTVLVEKNDPRIVVLTLNRPERRNSLSLELLNELVAAVENAQSDKQHRVLIFRGAGAAFCTGMDLKEAAVTADAHTTAEMVAKMLITVSSTPLITIAQVHGAAVAGGAGLMSACDFAIAAHGTKLGYPEGKRGLVAGLVMTFLRRQLRERDIRELLLTGDLIEAERAKEIGLVTRVVAREELENETMKIAHAILQNAPQATIRTKQLIEELSLAPVREHVERALAYHMEARESDEAKEGIAAFIEKRAPRWQP